MKSKLKDLGISLLYILNPIAVLSLLFNLSGYFIGIIATLQFILQRIHNNSAEKSFKDLIEYMSDYMIQSVNWIFIIGLIIVLVIYLLIFKMTKRDFFEMIKLKKTRMKFLISSSIIGIMLSFIIFGILSVANINYSSTYYEIITNALSSKTSLLSSIFLVFIAIPFFEEILFRGLILRQIKKSFPLVISVITQALLYALFYYKDLWGINAFLIGMVAAIICFRGNSLWNGILFHIFFNITYSIISIMVQL